MFLTRRHQDNIRHRIREGLEGRTVRRAERPGCWIEGDGTWAVAQLKNRVAQKKSSFYHAANYRVRPMAELRTFCNINDPALHGEQCRVHRASLVKNEMWPMNATHLLPELHMIRHEAAVRFGRKHGWNMSENNSATAPELCDLSSKSSDCGHWLQKDEVRSQHDELEERVDVVPACPGTYGIVRNLLSNICSQNREISRRNQHCG